jgi:hypothetical protein
MPAKSAGLALTDPGVRPDVSANTMKSGFRIQLLMTNRSSPPGMKTGASYPLSADPAIMRDQEEPQTDTP